MFEQSVSIKNIKYDIEFIYGILRWNIRLNDGLNPRRIGYLFQ